MERICMYTGIVIVPKATLYENPTKETVSDELLSGWLVTVVQERGRILKIITDYGYSGWINSQNIRRISTETFHHWKETPSTAILCRKTTDLLKSPMVQAPVLSTLFMGSRVILCGNPQDGWQKIRTAGGYCGYVPTLSLIAPPPPVPTTSGCLAPDVLSEDEWELRSCILNYAMSFLGTQYRWGGKTILGLDCSGFTFMCYYMCGIIIYRDAMIKEDFPVHKISFSCIKPADLLYFPGHVAIYLGNGKYIHCTGNPNSFGCVINSLRPEDLDYRADLAESLLAVGSVF